MNKNTKTKNWIHKGGSGGNKGKAPNSGRAHYELNKIIDNSSSLQEFKQNINPWANKWLQNGYSDLPSGFH
jgi:hypothetical protein